MIKLVVLWAIVMTAVLVAQVLGLWLGTLIMQTKFYRKMAKKATEKAMEDLTTMTFGKEDDEAKEETKNIDVYSL